MNEDQNLHGPLYGLPHPGPFSEGCIPYTDPAEPAMQLCTFEPSVAACRALWNACQTISKLPAETLIEIFLYLGKPSSQLEGVEAIVSCNGAKWFRMMLVCRRWRAVVKSNPCFWRNIVINDCIDWWHLAIARSGTATLRLSFESERSPPEPLIHEILACRSRIEHLDVSGSLPDSQWILPLVEGSLPSLTSFDWNVFMHPEDPYVLTPENYPKLTRLRLADTCLPWTVSFLSRLRSLQLHYCTLEPATISFKDFLEVLRSATQLEELELSDFMSGVCSYDSLQSTPASADPIRFPLLQDLHIQDATPWLTAFLAHVELPTRGCIAVTAIVIVEEVEDQLDLGAYASIFPRDLDRTPFFRTATSARLLAEEHGPLCWVIYCEAPGPLQFIFDFGSRLAEHNEQQYWWNPEVQGLSYFTRLLREAPLTKLELAIRLHYIESPVLRTLVETFPGIQELRIGQKEEHPKMSFPGDIFEAFSGRSYPRADDSEEYRHGLSWPNLKTIHVDGIHWKDGSFVPSMFQCLFERAKRGAPRLEVFSLTVFRTPHEDWTAVDTLIETTVARFADTYTLSVRPLTLPSLL